MYIYEQYIVIYMYIYICISFKCNIFMFCSTATSLRYMKRVACMGRGPTSEFVWKQLGGWKNKWQFLLGPMGVVSFFWGGKKIATCFLYRDDFRCLIINKNPVILLSNPEVEVVLECSSQVIKEENHSNWVRSKSACSRLAHPLFFFQWDFVPKDESL